MSLDDYKVEKDNRREYDNGAVKYRLKLVEKSSGDVKTVEENWTITVTQENNDYRFENALKGWKKRQVTMLK